MISVSLFSESLPRRPYRQGVKLIDLFINGSELCRVCYLAAPSAHWISVSRGVKCHLASRTEGILAADSNVLFFEIVAEPRPPFTGCVGILNDSSIVNTPTHARPKAPAFLMNSKMSEMILLSTRDNGILRTTDDGLGDGCRRIFGRESSG